MSTDFPTIGLLQLVALAIPAIAILKQVICNLNQRHHDYSNRDTIVTSSRGSETTEFKILQGSLIAMSVAGILLGIDIFIQLFDYSVTIWVRKLAVVAIISGLFLLAVSAFKLKSEVIEVQGSSNE